MYATEATTKGKLEKLLRCPRCKAPFNWEIDRVTCANCAAHYAIQSNGLPVYGLYVDDRPHEAGRDPTQIWRRDDFERNFETIGYHESGVEFDQQLGYPPEVSVFLFERVKKRLLEWVEPDAGHSILDVGCGAGYFLYLIRSKYVANGFSPTLVGLDSSTFQLSYMIQRMQKEGISDTISVHANSEYLPFADESFDVVTCSEVLEHIRNPLRALAEMHRVLKPEGRLLLSTPSMSAQKGWGIVLTPLSIPVKAIRRYKPNPDTAHGGYDLPWYAKELRGVIRTAKFEINNFEYNAVIPHPWHFKFCPNILVKPVVAGFKLADRYLKFFLKPLALHFVLRASKGISD